MTYCIYHIPGVKIGVTRDLKNRVEIQQGYKEDEYEILEMSDDIDYISERELQLQEKYGYQVDRKLYKDLYNNNFIKLNNMNINVTEMTTTFPCPIHKLKGRLMDNMDMSWKTKFGQCTITSKSIDWIMENVKSSQYTVNRCYVYNKAFARWFDNNDAYSLADLHWEESNGQVKTRTGALLPMGARETCNKKDCSKPSQFDLIRRWANERGLYEKGDTKTQTLKLIEEAGEICRAVLKGNHSDVIDGIGDCVVVLTNLAELQGVTIEECISAAYNEIKDRTGKMDNGTFKKD